MECMSRMHSTTDATTKRNGTLGLRMRARRLVAKLTQREVAERARTRQSVVSRFESGDCIPRRATLERIRRVLGER
jgi:transcriptional regulator with XRE-family HTH domain